MNLQEVKKAIEKELPLIYSVWSRSIPAGIEVGVNCQNISGSIASLLPIDDESRPRFAKFLADEVKRKDVIPDTPVAGGEKSI